MTLEQFFGLLESAIITKQAFLLLLLYQKCKMIPNVNEIDNLQ